MTTFGWHLFEDDERFETVHAPSIEEAIELAREEALELLEAIGLDRAPETFHMGILIPWRGLEHVKEYPLIKGPLQ